MVCNLHFSTGTSEFRIWNGRAFQKRKPSSFLDDKTLLAIAPAGREPMTSRTPRLYYKQGVPYPTCSVIGRSNGGGEKKWGRRGGGGV